MKTKAGITREAYTNIFILMNNIYWISQTNAMGSNHLSAIDSHWRAQYYELFEIWYNGHHINPPEWNRIICRWLSRSKGQRKEGRWGRHRRNSVEVRKMVWSDEGAEEYGREINIAWENYRLEQPTERISKYRKKKVISKAAEETGMTTDHSWFSVVDRKVHYAP